MLWFDWTESCFVGWAVTRAKRGPCRSGQTPAPGERMRGSCMRVISGSWNLKSEQALVFCPPCLCQPHASLPQHPTVTFGWSTSCLPGASREQQGEPARTVPGARTRSVNGCPVDRDYRRTFCATAEPQSLRYSAPSTCPSIPAALSCWGCIIFR